MRHLRSSAANTNSPFRHSFIHSSICKHTDEPRQFIETNFSKYERKYSDRPLAFSYQSIRYFLAVERHRHEHSSGSHFRAWSRCVFLQKNYLFVFLSLPCARCSKNRQSLSTVCLLLYFENERSARNTKKMKHKLHTNNCNCLNCFYIKVVSLLI